MIFAICTHLANHAISHAHSSNETTPGLVKKYVQQFSDGVCTDYFYNCRCMQTGQGGGGGGEGGEQFMGSVHGSVHRKQDLHQHYVNHAMGNDSNA